MFFYRTWLQVFRNIYRYRDFLRELIKIGLLSQFKKSFIGITWLIINPLVNVFIWLLLNAAGLFNPGETSIPYPAYILLSTSIWHFLLGFYEVLAPFLTQNGRLSVQTQFPHEVLIAEKVVVHSINFLIPFVLNIGVLLFYGVHFSWASLLFLPVLLPGIMFWLAVGLVISIVHVVAVDFFNAFNKLVALLIYVTPIVYSEKVQSEMLQLIIKWNPLSHLIGTAREVLISGNLNFSSAYWYSSLLALVLLLLAMRVYKVSERKVIERIPL